MPQLRKDLPGAEPVSASGAPAGPAATLRAGAEVRITVAMLHRPDETLEVYWSEIQVDGQLYRVSRKALDRALAG
jgi:hypothetical protein